MRRKIVNALLLATTVALLSLHWFLRPDPARRNYEFLPDMAESVAYDSYAVNVNFRDGRTLRDPVPGTIIRGQMPLHYTATKADAERAGRELQRPAVKGDRGALVYASHCETCHGPLGKGDGTVAQRGFPAPPSLLAPRAMTMADGQMFHILTYGQGNMPPYASHLDRDDRWHAVAYVRKLQGKRK